VGIVEELVEIWPNEVCDSAHQHSTLRSHGKKRKTSQLEESKVDIIIHFKIVYKHSPQHLRGTDKRD